MKKFIGFIGTYIFYYIGHFFSKLLFWKIKNTFIFDMKLTKWMGWIFGWIYLHSMRTSIDIQDWADLNSPWTKK